MHTPNSFYGMDHEYRIGATGIARRRIGTTAFVPTDKATARADVGFVYAYDQAHSQLESDPTTAGVYAAIAGARGD